MVRNENLLLSSDSITDFIGQMYFSTGGLIPTLCRPTWCTGTSNFHVLNFGILSINCEIAKNLQLFDSELLSHEAPSIKLIPNMAAHLMDRNFKR